MRDVHQKKLDVLFKDVCMLARIYLACPVTSVECERLFSVMRRLKTWLRRRTGQSVSVESRDHSCGTFCKTS